MPDVEIVQPNVVFVHSHDLGRHLGCYDRDVETPNVDALDEEGAQFTNYHCTAPQCSPSRASIMSGQYPHEVGMLGLAHVGWELDDDAPLLPGLLSAAGYDTHLFGVQHLARSESADPADLGYDTVHRDTTWSGGTAPLTGTVTPAVTEFLEERDGDEPFLATVGFFEPHRLGRTDRWDFSPVTRDRDDRWNFEGCQYEANPVDEVDQFPYLPDHPDVRADHAAFHGMIRAVDDAVGRIDAALEDAGLTEDTLVVFTTDHGIPFPRAKGTCYDAGTGTALLLRGPGIDEAVHPELRSNVDLLPTILDYLGLDVPGEVTGRSFEPLLHGGDCPPRERAFSEMTYHLQYCPIRAVRTQRYKYVRNLGDSPSVYMPIDVRHSKAGVPMIRDYYTESAPDEELYDLQADPTEQKNLVEEGSHETVLERLRDDVDQWMSSTADPLRDGVPEPPAAQRRLFQSARW